MSHLEEYSLRRPAAHTVAAGPIWCCTVLLMVASVVLVPRPLPAQDPEQSPGESPSGAVMSLADFSQPHLPSDKIADVFRNPVVVESGEDNSGSQGEGNPAKSNESSRELAERIETEVVKWVGQLGSPEFAVREQATAKLREIGKPAIPALRQTAADHPDLEVRMRAMDVAEGIASGETAGRIDAFLAGQEVPLDGWRVARQILGDGVRIRELFVDLLMRHGDVAAALDVTTAQRQAAFQATIVSIQRGMFVEGRLPTEPDLIALMLLANDRDLTINRVEEEALFSVLRREATNKLLTDAQLSGPFRALLGGWVSRDDVVNREAMLWFALSWDLAETFPLALSTLEKSPDPATLGMAMQAIARFGDASNIPDIAKFLADERVAGEQQFTAGSVIQAQLRDIAAATIVLLSHRELADFGMSNNAPHPKYGFNVREIGFPIEDPKPREVAIEKVRKELVPQE